MATHLKEIFPPLILKSSTILPSIYSTFFLKTWLPIAAACSDMEFDPCRSELYLGTTHYFFICLTILAMCKLQAVLIKVIMTSSYTAALFEGGKLPSKYGLTAECIYIRETFMKVLRGKKKICYKLIHGLNLTVKENLVSSWIDLQCIGGVIDIIFALQLWTEARPTAMLINILLPLKLVSVSTEIQKT